jgi:predicted aldo/keto reductase-like oxidoreductase
MVFNDLFCLSHSQVHTLSVGAARPSDFDEHLQTLDLLEQAETLLPPILERLRGAAIATLGEDWVNTWHQGLPSHEHTPGNINIPVILWLHNLAMAYDMHDYAQMRYNLLGQASHWFPGQKATQVANFDLRECLQASPHAAHIPELLVEADRQLAGQSVQRLSQSP